MEIEYYLEEKYKNVFAYNGETEFFVRFVQGENKWEACKFSFTAFLHDVEYKELTEDEAKALTGGSVPQKEFAEYREMLKRNLIGL